MLLELGGAFTAALAVDGGRIVDGLGGSSGPIGARACGALDAEAAYLIGGGAVEADRVQRRRARGGPRGPAARRPGGARGLAGARGGRRKAALALTASVPAPREILVAGRLAGARLLEALAGAWRRSRRCAPWPAAHAARGAALLADGLAGGRYAPLVECLRLREASGQRPRPPADARGRADPLG